MSQSSPQILQSHPEYIRMPKLGEREPISGLSRSSIDRLIRPQECNDFKPPVASRCVRIRGNARRGARLISLASLLQFLSKQPKQLKRRAEVAKQTDSIAK
jgi:predicted DNA-binding transcriptional regulator AlpA